MAPEKRYLDLLGRVAIIATSPIAYLAVGILAVLGIIADKANKDYGKENRDETLEYAVYAGNREIFASILNLNRHNINDLRKTLVPAGTRGNKEIQNDILDCIDRLNEKTDILTDYLFEYAINNLIYCNNADKEFANLAKEKYEKLKERYLLQTCSISLS